MINYLIIINESKLKIELGLFKFNYDVVIEILENIKNNKIHL